MTEQASADAMARPLPVRGQLAQQQAWNKALSFAAFVTRVMPTAVTVAGAVSMAVSWLKVSPFERESIPSVLLAPEDCDSVLMWLPPPKRGHTWMASLSRAIRNNSAAGF